MKITVIPIKKPNCRIGLIQELVEPRKAAEVVKEVASYQWLVVVGVITVGAAVLVVLVVVVFLFTSYIYSLACSFVSKNIRSLGSSVVR